MKIKIISWLIYLVVRCLYSTYRFRFINPDFPNTLTTNYILGLWHQTLIGSILSQPNKSHVVIASDSKDGEIVTFVCNKLGHHVARGSSTRGGVKAFKEILKLLRKNIPGAISVDGPKGPAKKAKSGIFELAKVLNIPVVPYAITYSNYWSFEKAWDQFRVPKPFSSIYIEYGEPIFVDSSDKEQDFFDAKAKLEKEINNLELKNIS